MKKLLTSPFGTFIKGFLSIILAMWVAELSNGHDLFSMDINMIKKLIVAGLVSNIHVIINWINPEYKGYGNKTIENQYPFDVYEGGEQVFCYEFSNIQLQTLILSEPPLNYVAYQTEDDGLTGHYVNWSGTEWNIGSGGIGLPRKKKI